MYIGHHKKLTITCPEHGEFRQRASAHIWGQGCPRCIFSKGEDTIEIYLANMNIDFISQKTFTKCKNKRLLRYDFYIPNFNLLIEYDGDFHYIPHPKDENNAEFERTKRNDAIKTKYAADNQIRLLRIPYWEFDNIARILDREVLFETSF